MTTHTRMRVTCDRCDASAEWWEEHPDGGPDMWTLPDGWVHRGLDGGWQTREYCPEHAKDSV